MWKYFIAHDRKTLLIIVQPSGPGDYPYNCGAEKWQVKCMAPLDVKRKNKDIYGFTWKCFFLGVLPKRHNRQNNKNIFLMIDVSEEQICFVMHRGTNDGLRRFLGVLVALLVISADPLVFGMNVGVSFNEKSCILSTSLQNKMNSLLFIWESEAECVTSALHVSSCATVSRVSRWGYSMHR